MEPGGGDKGDSDVVFHLTSTLYGAMVKHADGASDGWGIGSGNDTFRQLVYGP